MRSPGWWAFYALCAVGLLTWALSNDLSQPPTPPGHQQHYQQGESASGQKDERRDSPETLWQKITSEPVAFTTLCLTFVTGVLAFSTLALWIVTARAGARQSRDMRDSINVAERALTEVERAFVAVRDIGIDTYSNGPRLLGYGIHLNIINSGRTVARAYVTNITVAVFDKIPETFRFPDRNKAAEHQGVVTSGSQTFLLGQIAIQDVIGIFEKRKEALMYGWLEYSDNFSGNPRHRTEFCLKLEILGDPRTSRIVSGNTSILSAVGYGRYNATDDDCVYRPGETPVAEPGELPDITQPPQIDQTTAL
jgi:hypothetical protein